MNRDARLLREFQISLAVGGAIAVFAVLDVALAATGIYPWSRLESAAAQLAIAIVAAALAFGNARHVWLQRSARDIGGVTFADGTIVVGSMVLGGVLLLGLLR
jgi:hypothetical protein